MELRDVLMKFRGKYQYKKGESVTVTPTSGDILFLFTLYVELKATNASNPIKITWWCDVVPVTTLTTQDSVQQGGLFFYSRYVGYL